MIALYTWPDVAVFAVVAASSLGGIWMGFVFGKGQRR